MCVEILTFTSFDKLMPKSDPAKIKKVSFSLPLGINSVEWEADKAIATSRPPKASDRIKEGV